MGRDRQWAVVLWITTVVMILLVSVRIIIMIDDGVEVSPRSFVSVTVFVLCLAGFGWYLWDRNDKNGEKR